MDPYKEPSATELAALLAVRAEEVCNKLLPDGHAHHGNWVIGSVQGDEGSSLNIQLTGSRAGLWLDFNSGEKGDLIGLWRAARGISLQDTCSEAMAFLGIERAKEEPKEPSRAWVQLQREMGTGTEDDVETLMRLRRLPSANGLYHAIELGQLFFGPVFDKTTDAYHHSWIITDGARLGAQARRLDGQPYGDGQKSKTIHGTTGKWPIGLHGIDTPEIAFVEGGPDFLAAHTVICALGAYHIRPVAMLGSKQSIHPDAVPLFKDKTIWIFPHNDDNLSGLQGAIQWETQLKKTGATFIPFDFRPYPGVKDLNDFVTAACAAPVACEEEAP